MIGIRDWPAGIFILATLVALSQPLARSGAESLSWFERPDLLGCAAIGVAAGVWCQLRRREGLVEGLVLLAATAIAAVPPVVAAGLATAGWTAGWGLWLYVVVLGLLAWRPMESVAATRSDREIVKHLAFVLVPGAFGVWIIYLWQVVVVGFQVPSVLLPSPDSIAALIAASTDILAADFHQTFVKSVIPGFLIGCGTGFAVAILVDRVPFLQRGLLPLGNLVSALPIVGIAPIMVMWFGFDWQSKAAVVTIMTFFPMLVNCIMGLNTSGKLERDLMRSYGASYLQTLVALRIPNALPFIFNALKMNSTLALIGAIVAEFFGTPIVGMGFRISTEIGRMNVEMVWATIAMAAVSGSLFYGALTMLERVFTFWHPSYRR